ncbi:uncharacterized protein [Physcomitrium patens]|uniref:DUF668 domain-containing protein n=1 Tax=Physcomitrium patens TaxID=3218 RepID=A0A2K1KUN6_PHYPA|nr:uncharacterized protein LOC112279948 [Physcomitrium patens]XP_024370530.1 uncharacterized protein LOC112279948 [Physcomitrium patens]XP_024370531.1 uncharacterized protein LOC112279948 [Physcomitrium patens]XP_024370532.1 uncharacterized protein LOC112279948 [Physcomitrium patens]XP_024370533.1 uncharacterized protein LOC112279948 [Physcomitrium patens]PNR57494.1 hypothetical protein PHYPA_004488 [Physcomitrium patens]|eukprot:XP_024370529.1 uncharacterized protein LOC112279948 [Physcomitrella patens]
MGAHVSTIKASAGKLGPKSKKKGNKEKEVKIGILAFEVANIISKSMQLWQSLGDQEILRLRTEVIKGDGVLNLVSDNEAVLLSLACMEKLQDLTAVASAVSRLGQKCQEPTLQAFEHIYNDLLKHDINLRVFELPYKEMEAKMKKMMRYVSSTATLYHELEALADIEQAIRRLQEDDEVSNEETLSTLDQKAMCQRQEIKHIRDLSLWNHTYDKIVKLLAQTVCTIHGRIMKVFGSPMLGISHVFPNQQSGHSSRPIWQSRDAGVHSTLSSSRLSCPQTLGSLHHHSSSLHFSSVRLEVVSRSLSPQDSKTSSVDRVLGIADPAAISARAVCEYRSSASTFASGPLVSQRNYMSSNPVNPRSSPARGSQAISHSGPIPRSGPLVVEPAKIFSDRSLNAILQTETTEEFTSALLYFTKHSIKAEQVKAPSLKQVRQNIRELCDPKSRHRMAPWSTLGGAALALHYANVIIILENMIKHPHLIAEDARDDLYNMIPKSVRIALRSRLRANMRACEFGKYDSTIAADWKDALERILSWLAPLAHNMIRWQSEHNFEQQQVLSRTNCLLLQTLYFADLAKTEAAITELLVGLNYVCGHEQELKQNMVIMEEYVLDKETEDYLG